MTKRDIYSVALRKWQREFFLTAILECNGNMKEAAALVGINRTDFYRKCDRMGIVRTDQRGRKATINKGNKAWQDLGRSEGAPS